MKACHTRTVTLSVLLALLSLATGACAHGQLTTAPSAAAVGPGWTKVAVRAGAVGSTGAWYYSAPFHAGAGVVRMTGVVTMDDPEVPAGYGIALMRGRRPAAAGADQVPIDAVHSPVVTAANEAELFDMVSTQRLKPGYYCVAMQSGENAGFRYSATIYVRK